MIILLPPTRCHNGLMHPTKTDPGPDSTPTVEDYLLAIASFEYEHMPVIAARLAERLGVSAPTVSATVKRMVRDGWIQVQSGNLIELTDSGRTRADRIVRRHRLIERWLQDQLGLEWSALHEEADRLEHAISQRLEERISAALGHPETCPHGNPIPGNVRTWSREGLWQLSQVPVGTVVEVRRISELIEEQTDLLAFIQDSDLIPGNPVRIADRSRGGMMDVQVSGNYVQVGENVGRYIWVMPKSA